MAIDIIARGMIESSKNDISQLFDITKGGEIVNNEFSYTLNNAVDYPLLGLSIHGKSTQGYASYGGTPVGKNLVDPSKITNGGFDYATGAEINNSARARTGYIAVKPTYLIGSVPDGYSILSIYHYTAAKEFLGVGGVSLLNGQNGFIRLLFKRNDNAAITDDDLNALKNSAIVTNGESTDYEPYMGTPNPECPVPIDSVGDSGAVEITSCGKNLLDVSNCINATNVVSGVSNGIISFKKVTNQWSKSYIGKFYYKKGTIITISANNISCGRFGLSNSNTHYPAISYNSVIYTVTGELTTNVINYKKLKNTVALDYDGMVYIWFCSDGNIENAEEFSTALQVEIGSAATDFEPYKGNTASITTALPLCGIPVDSGGNYTDNSGQQWVCDELIYNADGTGKIIKRAEKQRLTGNSVEKMYGTENSVGFYRANIILNKLIKFNGTATKVNVKCTHYPVSTADSMSIASNTNSVEFAIAATSTTRLIVGVQGQTIEEYRNFVNQNEIYIVYELETPQEIELTADEISAFREMQTFDGVTNITNDSGADMDVKFCANKMLSKCVMPILSGLQKQIDELKAAVLSLGSNV